MSKLLIRESFDRFLLEKAQVLTASEMTLSGRRSQSWYDTDIWEELERKKPMDCRYMFWKEVKPTVFSYIKGSQSPQTMRLSFKAAQDQVEELLMDSGVLETYRQLMPDLLLQLRYEQGKLQLVTGIAFSRFEMDKTIERAWDEAVRIFLHNEKITYEEGEI